MTNEENYPTLFFSRAGITFPYWFLVKPPCREIKNFRDSIIHFGRGKTYLPIGQRLYKSGGQGAVASSEFLGPSIFGTFGPRHLSTMRYDFMLYHICIGQIWYNIKLYPHS